MTTQIGSNQIPGGMCPDRFHLVASDRDFEIDYPHPTTGSACPTCAAIMMPGSAVSPTFYAEYRRRIADGICLANRRGLFVHDRKASKKALAGGACLCAQHNR